MDGKRGKTTIIVSFEFKWMCVVMNVNKKICEIFEKFTDSKILAFDRSEEIRENSKYSQ